MQKNLIKNGNFARILAIFVIVASALFVLSACGGGTSPDGTWKVDRIVMDNVTIKASDTDKKGQDDAFKNVIILNKDKTGKVTMGTSAEVSTTWKQENSTITITYGDKDYAYMLSGSELTKTDGTTKIFYKKS